MTVADVRLWGRTIAAVSWDDDQGIAHFEYDPAFILSGREIAPLTMPLSDEIHSFPALPRQTFAGLPGLLADSLPDRFGNALIDAWLARQGRSPGDLNSVERLCYIGTRGMGALEFAPGARTGTSSGHRDRRGGIGRTGERDPHAARRCSRVHSSPLAAGRLSRTSFGSAPRRGAHEPRRSSPGIPRPTRSAPGRSPAGEGFSHWLLKFDGVAGNRDRELEDPQGYGLIEYAYHAMARSAGIHMNECRILREDGRNHFMTRRFDRTEGRRKLHMQSLGAMAHYDFNQPGACSYEQAMRVIERLELPKDAVEEQFRRMAFNIVARNQDDHVKNIAFLMDRYGALVALLPHSTSPTATTRPEAGPARTR